MVNNPVFLDYLGYDVKDPASIDRSRRKGVIELPSLLILVDELRKKGVDLDEIRLTGSEYDQLLDKVQDIASKSSNECE